MNEELRAERDALRTKYDDLSEKFIALTTKYDELRAAIDQLIVTCIVPGTTVFDLRKTLLELRAET